MLSTQAIKLLSIWTILTPLIGAGIAGFLGKVIGRRATQLMTILGVLIAFIFSLILFDVIVINHSKALTFQIFNWVHSGSYQFNISLLVDHLSACMIVVVTFVSLLVHIYSIGYMAHDKSDQRFFCYMSAFTFAMLCLVLANNFLLLFFGWEGVGLVSYLLIGYWFHKESAVVGSLKAFIVNRVGDMGFILGIAAILSYYGSLNYQTVFQQTPHLLHQTITIIPGWHWSVISMIAILLFIGAMGKSAQMPLHVWLPESMEGPTPISALIHAATMVTAGVYMIARMSPIFEFSTTALSMVIILGATTCLFCGLLGLFAFDLKRVIAYSTLSQLGYMMVGVGSSAYAAGMFHLFTHAFFKALLFLAAGSVIIAMHEEQDMRKMGGLARYLPVTYICFLIGGLALAAIPPFSGFYSKDAIIEAAHLSTIPGSSYAYICVLLGAFVTAAYTFRAFFMTFHGKSRIAPELKGNVHESPLVVTVPLVLLAIASIIAGFMLVRWILYTPSQTALLGNSLFILPVHNVLKEMAQNYHGVVNMTIHGLETLPFGLAVLGIIVAWLTTMKIPQLAEGFKHRLPWLYAIFVHKYGFDEFNQIVFVRWSRALGNFLFKGIDMLFIDKLFVNGSGRVVATLSRVLRVIQSGYIYQYVFIMFIGVLVLLVWRLIT
ncbi:MAG: NADH-quinone oxidoreductase subunit L [Pseudomonadota bacterium]